MNEDDQVVRFNGAQGDQENMYYDPPGNAHKTLRINDKQEPTILTQARVSDKRPDVLIVEKARPDYGDFKGEDSSTILFAADQRFSYDDESQWEVVLVNQINMMNDKYFAVVRYEKDQYFRDKFFVIFGRSMSDDSIDREINDLH